MTPTAAPLDLNTFPASLLQGFPFEDAAQHLIRTTQCTPKEAELALAHGTLHPSPLTEVARCRFADFYLQGTFPEVAEFIRHDDYARKTAELGALIEVEYKGRPWTCEVSRVGKRDMWCLI